MGIKAIVVLLIGLAFGSVHLAEAQQSGKVYRIGFLVSPSRSFFATRMEGFQRASAISATLKEKTL
jgi:hypothetical protein